MEKRLVGGDRMFSYKELQQLNGLEMEVYNYVILHLDQISNMKIRDLAEHAHVSTTTIMRFCNKLGCDGYSEFKLKVKMLREEKVENQLLETPALMIDFFNKAKTIEFDTMLEQAAKLILDSNKIIFYGIGSSGTLGKYGARFFSNIGKYAQHLEDPFYPYPKNYFDNTVLFVLSVQGEQRTIIEQIGGYKAQHCKVISITNTDVSTIAKMSDLNISYYMPLNVVGKSYNITTQVPVIYILESIGRKLQRMLENK